jgi:DICT domain-containing protein
MTLRQLIGAITELEKELTVFNTVEPGRLQGELAAYFRTQNVRIRTERTPSGRPVDVAVLSDDDAVVEVLDVGLLRGLLDHSPDDVGVADAAYDDLLRHLKETTFTAYDTEQMLYASREIEDRARRVGRGRIHAGFQQCSVIDDQRTVYADLGGRELDVHTYGAPDVAPPDLEGVRVHPTGADEVAATWFVVYDGGGNDAQKTALLAEERSEDRFYGALTYDPGIVDAAVAHLERTYVADGAHTRSEP